MKKRLCLLLLPILTLACGPKEDKSAEILSEDAMTSLMLDIHLADARISRTIQHYDSAKLSYVSVHKKLLKKHQVSDSAFKKSYDYYISHPALMDKIYERILDSLSLKEAKLTGKDTTSKPNPAPALPEFRKGI